MVDSSIGLEIGRHAAAAAKTDNDGVGLHSATHTTHAFPPRLETIHPPTSALLPADSALPTLSLPVHPILPDVVVVVALVISRTSAVPEVRGSIRRQSVESYDLIIEVLRNSYVHFLRRPETAANTE